MANTRIEYLYTDASNYKVHNSCIIKGELTNQQKAAILACRHEGEFFIPSKVGMPEERFADWNDQDDHIWFKLFDDSFYKTDADATLDLTADELAERFAQCKDRWEYPLIYAECKQNICPLCGEEYFCTDGDEIAYGASVLHPWQCNCGAIGYEGEGQDGSFDGHYLVYDAAGNEITIVSPVEGGAV